MKNFLKILRRVRVILIISTFLLPGSCVKVYDPNVDSVASEMVVDASLSTVPGVHKIRLSYSNPYNANSKYNGFTGAKVSVSDDQGRIIPFGEIGQGGFYETDTNESIKAEIGRTYTLHIITKEGDVFVSEPQTILKCAPMDSLFCENDEQKVLDENGNGDSYEVIDKGMRVEVNSKGLYPNHNFYLYSWVAYEEYCVGLVYGPFLHLLYTHVPLPSKYDKDVCTGNADNYVNQQLSHNRLLFIPNKELQNFTGSIPDSLLEGKNHVQFENFQGLIFRLEQKSISDNAYMFWSSVQSQLDASGKLFDPVASQIAGNIICTNNPQKKAFGVFYAYDVSEKYAYLYMSVTDRISSKPLNEFPKLVVDSFYWEVPPPGWVSPPF